MQLRHFCQGATWRTWKGKLMDTPYGISTHTKLNYEEAREAIITALKQCPADAISIAFMRKPRKLNVD